MNSVIRIPLTPSAQQLESLLALQSAFAQVCNALSPKVKETRVWNRVALHHLMYRSLRNQFPQVGSQMVCNAIYSVSRTCRLVYQHPQSPFNLDTLGDKPLPLLHFADSCPVYFDRHTLSIGKGLLSLYTLDGRMRFSLTLRAEEEAAFRTHKLREIVMARTGPHVFELRFTLSDSQEAETNNPALESDGDIPDYVIVQEETA